MSFSLWIKEEPRGGLLLYYFFLFLTIAFSITPISTLTFEFFKIDTSSMSANTGGSGEFVGSYYVFLIILMCSAFLEECFFRYLPMVFVYFFNGRLCTYILMSVLSSIIFGYLHGNIFNLAFQGLIGFIHCISFLKCGGLQNHRLKALLFSTGIHFGYNAIITLMILTH